MGKNRRKNKKEKKTKERASETENKPSSSKRSGTSDDESTVDRVESFQPGPGSSPYTRNVEQFYQLRSGRISEVNLAHGTFLACKENGLECESF